ncbi:U3 snoRNP protein [Linnemannia zychae]|nr:U3 snoRNP protein [Linnemannia zychae]
MHVCNRPQLCGPSFEIPNVIEEQMHRLQCDVLDKPRNNYYVELFGYDNSPSSSQSKFNPGMDTQDSLARPLMKAIQNFLAGSNQMLLLTGDYGSGKTAFLNQLERELWTDYKSIDTPIPIFIDLRDFSGITNNLLEQALSSRKFDKSHIHYLKDRHCKFIIICDGYDQALVQGNIYNLTRLDNSEKWQIKMIIACRSGNIERDSDTRFEKVSDSRSIKDIKLGAFHKVAIAPFTFQQIREYIKKVAASPPTLKEHQCFCPNKDIRQCRPKKIPLWSADQYIQELMNIPYAMELAKNPYFLSIILDLLPSFAASQRSVPRTSFDLFYKHFFVDIMETSRHHLYSGSISHDEQKVLSEMPEKALKESSIQYLKTLATAIFKEQHGNPSIQYLHQHDRIANPWKSKFFGPDPKVTILRKLAPIVRLGNHYQFIHSFILEYLYSLSVFDPDNPDDFNIDYENTDTAGSKWSDCERDKYCAIPTSTTYLQLDSGQKSEKDRALPPHHPLGVTNISSFSVVCQFLIDRVQHNPSFKERLVETVRKSRAENNSCQNLAANAMTILIRSGMLFNGADLRGLKIKGANLTGGCFDSADFRDSDLRNVIFDKCWMRQARFEGAQMSGVQFVERVMELDDAPCSTALSSRGDFYAIGFNHGSIAIYSTSDWKLNNHIRDFPCSITPITFSPFSELLLFGDVNGDLRTFEYTKNTSITTSPIHAHDDQIFSIECSKDGKHFATAGYDTIIKIWDASSFSIVQELIGHGDVVTSVAFSPDSKWLLSGSSDSTIRLWDVNSGQLTRIIDIFDDTISKIRFTSEGKRFAYSSANDNIVRIQSMENETWDLELRGNSEGIASIDFSPNNIYIISCCEAGAIQIWDSHSGRLEATLDGHSDYILSISYMECGDRAVSCSLDKTIRVWDCQSSIKEATIPKVPIGLYPYLRTNQLTNDHHNLKLTLPRPYWEPSSTEKPLRKADNSIIFFSPDGTMIASATSESINIWYRGADTIHCSLNILSNNISAVTFSPDGQLIATVVDNCILQVWSIQSKEVLWTLDEDKNEDIACIAYSPSGHQIASGSRYGDVKIWDAETGVDVYAFSIDDGQEVSCITFSTCGRLLASGDEYGSLRAWDAINHKDEPIFIMEECHPDTVTHITFSPNNTHIASACDGQVKVWKIGSKELVHTLSVEDKSINRLAYSPSGQFIACGISDGVVKIWDAITGAIYTVLSDYNGALEPMFSLDGLYIWTRSSNFIIRSWIDITLAPQISAASTTEISRNYHQIAWCQGGTEVCLFNANTGFLELLLKDHSADVESLVFSPAHNDIIATSCKDGVVRIWNSQTGECMAKLECHEGEVAKLIFSPSGMQIATHSDNMLRLWNFSTIASAVNNHANKRLTQILVDGFVEYPVYAATVLMYSPDGKEISVCTIDDGVRRFDTGSGENHPVALNNSRGYGIATCIVYSLKGDKIAACGGNASVCIWNRESGDQEFILTEHSSRVICISLSPFRNDIATGDTNGTIRLSAPTQQDGSFVLKGHNGSVLCIAYSPDGMFIASGGADKSVRLWDALTTMHLSTIKDFVAGVKSIRWKATLEGLILVTGCDKNPLQVWELVEEAGRYELQMKWGQKSAGLAVSGAVFERHQGLDEDSFTLLEQKGAHVLGRHEPVVL